MVLLSIQNTNTDYKAVRVSPENSLKAIFSFLFLYKVSLLFNKMFANPENQPLAAKPWAESAEQERKLDTELEKSFLFGQKKLKADWREKTSQIHFRRENGGGKRVTERTCRKWVPISKVTQLKK
ncbi:hypothetical protein CDAR_86211 [Caerostris darwini]|uniref:Uncharacterized protein n=1 Tax=Caerostris darwini TaxID=1538125 RepID=A0AAV4QGM1_9ARAC|nr:hypothetical protein CDAR_86211 [Caerostris darwini]